MTARRAKPPKVWRLLSDDQYPGPVDADLGPGDADGTRRVRFRDGSEADVRPDDLRPARNSHDLRIRGDWHLSVDPGRWHVVASRVGHDISALADHPERVRAVPETRSPSGLVVQAAGLEFRDFDALLEWGARTPGVPTGWAPDRFGTWVDAAGPLAVSGPARPCTRCSGPRPRAAADGDTLCKMHRSHADRADEHTAALHHRIDEQMEKARRGKEADRAAVDWSARIADEFGVRAKPAWGGSGNLAVAPEGLYALLDRVRADAPWLLDDLPVELAARPDADEGTGR